MSFAQASRVALLAMVAVSVVPSQAEDLISSDGTRYTSVRVSGETADAVKIIHSGGIATIPKAKIPRAFLEAHELTVPPINTTESVTSELDTALAKFKTTTPEFTARDGRRFKSSEITAIDPAGIKLMGASGILRLQFSELPPSMRVALGHDLSKAEKFNADQATKAKEDADKKARLAEAASTTDMFGRRTRLLLRQNFDKGWVCMGEVLVDGEVEVVSSRSSASLSGPKVINEVTRRTETRVAAQLGKIMVFGLPSYTDMSLDLQGGRVWSGQIYKIGSYNLISADTQESTQTGAYHVDRTAAVRLIAENGLAATYTSKGEPADTKPAEPAGGSVGVGTAFAINADGYFATAAHVVENAKVIEALVEQQQHPATVVMINNEMDLAIIRIEGVKIPPLRLKETGTTKAGASLFAVGFPLIDALGKNAKLTTGSLTAHTGMSDDPNTFQMSIPIQPGNSGGPVCDEFGHVIGIVSKTVSTLKGAVFANGAVPQNVNFAAKADLLIGQAKEANVKLPDNFDGKGTAQERVMASTILLTVKE